MNPYPLEIKYTDFNTVQTVPVKQNQPQIHATRSVKEKNIQNAISTQTCGPVEVWLNSTTTNVRSPQAGCRKSSDKPPHADIIAADPTRYCFAPLQEDVWIHWKHKNPDLIAESKLELFCLINGRRKKIWTKTFIWKNCPKNAKTLFKGDLKLFNQGDDIRDNPGLQSVTLDYDNATYDAKFPGGCVTAEFSPYRLKLSVVSKTDSIKKRPQFVWMYFDVRVHDIDFEWCPDADLDNVLPNTIKAQNLAVCRSLADAADNNNLNGAIPIPGQTKKVYLKSHTFYKTASELTDITYYNRYRTLWGDGAMIPIFAKVRVRQSDGSGVFAPLALGKLKFLWDWVDRAAPSAAIGDASIQSWIDDSRDYKAAATADSPAGENCHVDRGGKRGLGAKTCFPQQTGKPPAANLPVHNGSDQMFPFKVEPLNGVASPFATRKWAAYSYSWASGILAGKTGVLFQPSRMAGDGYELNVYLAYDTDAEMETATPANIAAGLHKATGTFQIWRELAIIKHWRMKTNRVNLMGNITNAGNATVTVTAAGMPNSPKVIAVAAALNDTGNDVADKIRIALNADPDVSGFFTVGGEGSQIQLTPNVAGNDPTMSITINNGTCAGLIPAASDGALLNLAATQTKFARYFIKLTVPAVVDHNLGNWFPALQNAVAGIPPPAPPLDDFIRAAVDPTKQGHLIHLIDYDSWYNNMLLAHGGSDAALANWANTVTNGLDGGGQPRLHGWEYMQGGNGMQPIVKPWALAFPANDVLTIDGTVRVSFPNCLPVVPPLDILFEKKGGLSVKRETTLSAAQRSQLKTKLSDALRVHRASRGENNFVSYGRGAHAHVPMIVQLGGLQNDQRRRDRLANVRQAIEELNWELSKESGKSGYENTNAKLGWGFLVFDAAVDNVLGAQEGIVALQATDLSNMNLPTGKAFYANAAGNRAVAATLVPNPAQQTFEHEIGHALFLCHTYATQETSDPNYLHQKNYPTAGSCIMHVTPSSGCNATNLFCGFCLVRLWGWSFQKTDAAGAILLPVTRTLWYDSDYNQDPGSPAPIPPHPTGGSQQTETLTVVGAITAAGAGNATVTVTAAGMLNSPKAVSFAVANNDDANAVANKARLALNADVDVSAFFTIDGANALINLTAKAKAANDGTMNVAIDNGTCAGLTAVAASAHTRAGIAPPLHP